MSGHPEANTDDTDYNTVRLYQGFWTATTQKEYTELNRCVTRREYEKVLDYAFELGIENGFFQDGETARESFIPAFDYEGVRKML